MNELKVYLDNCCFNRQYDDQTQRHIFYGMKIVRIRMRQKEKP